MRTHCFSVLITPILLLLLPLCWLATAAVAAEGGPGESGAPLRLVDRILAVVDEDPIFLSDVQLAIRLGRFEASLEDGVSVSRPQVLERSVLERLVEERLRQHEVDRFAVGPLPPESIEAQLEMLGSRFPDHQAMVQELGRYGLDEGGLRHQIRRQLRVVRYVEERLRPRIFVDLADIEAYYSAELPDLLAVQGIALPPLEDVREEVRGLLQERRLSKEIELWTAELRAAADIVQMNDPSDKELPPVLRRIGGS